MENINLRESYSTIDNNYNKDEPYIFLDEVLITGCDGKDIKIY